jgi:hypothetical protein
MYLDGVEQTESSCTGQYAFSPDCKHLLMAGVSVRDPNTGGLFLDGKLVGSGPGVVNTTRPVFTPDSAHVFWLGNRPSDSSDDHDNAVLYADGKATGTHFRPITNQVPGGWEMGRTGC